MSHLSTTGKSLYTGPVSKEIGFGIPFAPAATSRNTDKFAAFAFEAPVLAAQVRSRKTRRFLLRRCAGIPTRLGCRPVWNPSGSFTTAPSEANMASSHASGATAQTTSIVSALTVPNAPRALLVSLNRTGQLEQVPVLNGESLLNIEADLQDHLSATPVSTEWLLNLRDYIDCRLAARSEARGTGGVAIARKNGFDIAHINDFRAVEVQQ